MKNKALISAIFCIFLLIGAVSAADIDAIDSNSIQENNILSSKSLEVSSNYSVSELNSHDDNLINYPSDDDFNAESIYESNYGDNKDLQYNSLDDVAVSNENAANINANQILDTEDPIDIVVYDIDSVASLSSSIDASDIVKYYKNDTQYSATFFDSDGNPLANTTVSIIINNQTYYRVTDENGTIVFNINLNPGKYVITAINPNTTESISNNITVLSTISGDNIVMYYRNGTKYYATFLNSDGTPLANTDVTFNINGVFYTRTTDEKGNAFLNINLNAGVYVITAINPINQQMYSNNITILPTISGNNVVKYYKNGTQYYATFLKGDGSPLANTDVLFNINGVMYTRTTDENGTARLNINLNAGVYIITAINPVNNETYANNITILPTISGNDIVKLYRNGTQYYATFLNEDGTPLANTNVTFNINGVFYTRTTNENGIARLNINLNPGKYVITAINPLNQELYSNVITVLKATPVIIGEDVHRIFGTPSAYSVLLTYENGDPISGQDVYFQINGKSYYAKTDENGTAIVILDNLKYGENLITYGVADSAGFSPVSGSSIINVINSTTILTGSDLEITYGKSGEFKVLLTDLHNKPLSNKTITFIIDGKYYYATTDENGIATLLIENYVPGKYTVQYFYSTPESTDYNFGSSSIIVNKKTAVLEGADLTIKPGEKGHFDVTVKDANGTLLTNATVTFTIRGIEYNRTTNEYGVASLNINLGVGFYPISYKLASNPFYQSGSYNNTVLVDGYTIHSNVTYVTVGTTSDFEVLLKDAYGNPVSDAKIKFVTSTGEEFEAITNKEGIATIKLSDLTVGEYTINYYFYSDLMNVSGFNYVYVKNAIPISDLINAAISVRNYIENNLELPTTVTIAGSVYSMPQFLYLLSKAIVNFNSGITSDVGAPDVLGPENPVSTQTSLGNLYTYVDVAKSVIAFMDANGLAPNSMSSDVGNIGYDALIYAFTRTVAWYGEHGNTLPSYTSIKPVTYPIDIGVLDDINTIVDLAPYLEPSLNCQVNNAKIQALAASLTAGMTSELAKATAIYNYVRNSISYSFYYNTKYGAVGTLERGYGNCCDQAQLLVALCRAAGLYSRFVHSTYCVFNSGTYGHVWAQILIGDVWVVADPTSSRNSFGVVNNWNNYNHGAFRYYQSLPF